MRSIGAEGVIIADKSLSKKERLVIVDQCLEFNYKVYVVPVITDWENERNFAESKEFKLRIYWKEKLLCWTIRLFPNS
jgi:hypothetical protein